MERNFHSHVATKPNLLKQINYARLLDLLRCHAPITRAELAKYTGLTRSTVTVITAELIVGGLVQEDKEITTPGSGRPGIGLVLNPQGAFFIGASIESEQLTVVELNLAAQTKQCIQEPFLERDNPQIVLNQLVKLINCLRQSNPLSQQRLRSIGLTIQGTLSLDGVVISAPFLGWEGVDLRRYLQPYINLPLFVDNDANAAALAEVYLGNAIQTHSLLYLLINKGMGAGIVINNRVFRGAYGTAGEVGAWLVKQISGTVNNTKIQPADFGLSVGIEQLFSNYHSRGGTASDIGELAEHLAKSELLAKTVMDEWTEGLGWGLVNLVNLLNPERIVIGGPLIPLLPYVKNHLDNMLRVYVPGDGKNGFFSNPKASFDISTFGEYTSALGGAVLAYQSLFRVPDLVLL